MDNIKVQVLNDINIAVERFRKKERVIKLYDSFFVEFSSILSQLKNNINNKNELKKILHTLKGASANIKMNLIANTCIKLEESILNDRDIDYLEEIKLIEEYGELYKNAI